MHNIDYHADDYGISLKTSKGIIELIKAGKLDSISILTNMGCYEECISLLENEWDSFNKKPLVSIHLNTVGGLSLIQNGRFGYTWSYLFIHSLIPGKKYKLLKNQIKNEFKCQISRLCKSPVYSRIRMDSHQHTHMIPLVFDAMMEAVNELNLMDELEYVRITREPILPFITTKNVIRTVPFVNFVKNIILNILSVRVVRKLKPCSLDGAMAWGMMRSGMVDIVHHNAMKDKILAYANKKDRYIELIVHPGDTLDASDTRDCSKKDMEFWKSEYRQIEYSMLMEK